MLFSWSCEYQKAFFSLKFSDHFFLDFSEYFKSAHFFSYLRWCPMFTTYIFFFYFVVTKSCHVVWWICGVGSYLCGFLISLIFELAIIVGVSVDLCVWLCQNLIWNIFCLFFLHVNKWFVWHFTTCFQRTFSRRMRFGTTCHHVPFVQYTSNWIVPPPPPRPPKKHLTSCNYVIKYSLCEMFQILYVSKFRIKEVPLLRLKVVCYTYSWKPCHFFQIPIMTSLSKFLRPSFSPIRRVQFVSWPSFWWFLFQGFVTIANPFGHTRYCQLSSGNFNIWFFQSTPILCNSSHLIIFWVAMLVAAVGIELANFRSNKH